jgi:hypothetical protein
MNITWNNLSKLSSTALSTMVLLAIAETATLATTLTGTFEISQFGSGNAREENLIFGNFGGNDLDDNGILSQSELSQFSADIVVDNLSLINLLSFNDIFNFELDLNSLSFNFLFEKQETFGTDIPNSPFCATPEGDSCLLEKIVLREDLAYFFTFEYSDRANLRFLTQIEAGAIAQASNNPPLVSVNLTSQPPQTVPEPNVILGMLAVLGLGKQLKKIG